MVQGVGLEVVCMDLTVNALLLVNMDLLLLVSMDLLLLVSMDLLLLVSMDLLHFLRRGLFADGSASR